MKPSVMNYLRPHLWFNRGGELFAVAMDYLQEVTPLPDLRPLPAAEPALAGLIHLREHVLPVFDPLSLAAPGSELPALSKPIVIVLGWHRKPALAILAEQIGKVIQLPALRPLSVPARVASAFAGEAPGENRQRLLILDVAGISKAMGLMETRPLAGAAAV